MGDLSEHFSRHEFACKCGCGFDTVDAGTLAVLEAIRQHFGAPVKVTSGCRCFHHNRDVGGAPSSQHRLGRAADIQVEGVVPGQVQNWLDAHYPDSLGMGRYKTFTHVDTRTSLGAVRWRG